MSETYSACVTRVRREASEKVDAARAQRLEKTHEITRLWKEGFARLKAENDRLQKERDDRFRNEEQMVHEWLADMLEGCQR